MYNETNFQLKTHEEDLRRYLPEQLLRPFLSRPNLLTARPCNKHLDELLHAVSTYLPRYLVNELLQERMPGKVGGQFREATIMFADISGFTAMSERLSLQGEKGAEKITNIVGDYFTRLLDITARQGGDLLKFGGDALLVAFFGDNDPITVDHAVRACRAAAQMQEAIARFSAVEAFGETFRLKMTTGLGSGYLFTANLGNTDKMEYTVMGEALANMAHAEDQAEGGEIFIDENTYQAIREQIKTDAMRNGCYRVTRIRGSDEPGPFVATPENLPRWQGTSLSEMDDHIRETMECLDVLVPFLPPGLLDLLRFDPTHMVSREKGEFRPVTTIFANFYGIEEIITALGAAKTAEITAILNRHFTNMQEIIHRYEGVIDKVDSYVVGHRIMALFGAPRAHVDDPERAVHAAWEMQCAMGAFSNLETSEGTFALKQRIGINSGRVFAGNVGSETRHEYSVMGDEVNLTARLMSAAQEEQILISQSTAQQIGKRFQLNEKEPVKVKGKSQPVPNYEVLGILKRHQTGELARRSPLIGRQEEWQTIRQVAKRAAQGQCQILDIHGEMGMGKSRIIEELVEHWNKRGTVTFSTGCLSYGRHTPYAPWGTILRDLFGLRESDSDQERREKIVGRLAAASPEWIDWAALIANQLGVSMEESDLVRSLDPKLRQQNLQRIVASLLASEAAYHPTLLIIDDIQWIDQVSLALLNYVSAHIQSQPLLLCIAYRPEEKIELTATQQPNCTTIVLKALTEQSSLALLQSQLPTEPEMPQRLQEIILKNAQGNPLFIVEMAHALIENYLCYDAEQNVYRAREDLDRVQVPDTVSRVILSRLDRLDEQSRNMLKVASAIGRAFQQWLLQSVYPYKTDKAEMSNRLLNLCEREILDQTISSAEIAYLYRHIMTREVAYESLLYAERRELHRKIAQSIEAQLEARIEEYLEVLAEHYTLAEDWPQALTFHIKSARRAQDIYANQDAIHHYKQAIEIADHIPDALLERLSIHEGLGDTYDLAGQYDEAIEHYERAQTVLDSMVAFPQIKSHRADLYRRMAHVYECKSEYDTAQSWIEKGLETLANEHALLEAARLFAVRTIIYHRQGNNKQALEWCKQTMQVAEEIQSQEGMQEMAHAAALMGEIYRRLGDNERAVEFAQRGLDTYKQLENIVGQGQAHITLGNIYSQKYNWQIAMDHYLQAMAIKEKMGDVYGQGVLAINIGDNYRIMGQLEQSIAFCQRSLRMWEELGVTYGKGLSYNNLGAVYLRMGDLEQATHHLEQSEQIFAQIPSEDFVAETSRYRAEVALQQGQLDQALAFAQRSLQYAIEQGLKADECATRRVLGMIHLQNNESERAEAYLDQSLHMATELDNRYEIGQTMLQLGLLWHRQHESTRALHALRRARAIFEELDAKLGIQRVDQILESI